MLGRTVLSTRALRGGMSSAMHPLTVRYHGGELERVVLRRCVRAELNDEESDIAEYEARMFRLVEEIDVPTSELLALDFTGAAADVSSVLMSRLPDRMERSPTNMDRWLERLAVLLPFIHATTVASPGIVRPFIPDLPTSYEPPF